jgi:DNA-binding CsgD family transcriptional regulator
MKKPVEQLFGKIHQEKLCVSKVAKNAGLKPSELFRWKTQGVSPAKINALVSLCEEMHVKTPSYFIYGVEKSPHEIIIPGKISEKLAYLIGYWFGDGTLSKQNNRTMRIEFYDECKEQLELIAGLILDIFGLRPSYWRKDPRHNCWIVRYNSVLLGKYFENVLGLPSGRRIKTGYFPEFVEPPELAKAFVAGFFDAEGHIFHAPNTGYHLVISQRNSAFLEKFKELLVKLGFESKFQGPRIRITGKEKVLRFLKEIPIRHPDKLKSSQLALEGKPTRKKIRLSKAKKRVLATLLQNKTAIQIALELGVTKHTALRHLQELLIIGGVEKEKVVNTANWKLTNHYSAV